jgi:hypothetical protein
MPQRPAIVVGTGATLGEVDRIAIYKAAVQNMVCDKYVGGVYKTPIDIPITLEQRRFELHDRRTGAVVVDGALTATFKCPTKITTDAIRPGMNVRLKGAEIQTWLQAHAL